MWQLNIQVYLELSEVFIILKKYDLADRYLEQGNYIFNEVMLNDENNERGKLLQGKIKSDLNSNVNWSWIWLII